jgi:hypothetical protein
MRQTCAPIGSLALSRPLIELVATEESIGAETLGSE